MPPSDSSDQALVFQLRPRLLHAILRRLAPAPLGELREPLLEAHARDIAQEALGARDVGDAVADVALPEPPEDLGVEGNAERPAQAVCDRDTDVARPVPTFRLTSATSVRASARENA